MTPVEGMTKCRRLWGRQILWWRESLVLYKTDYSQAHTKWKAAAFYFCFWTKNSLAAVYCISSTSLRLSHGWPLIFIKVPGTIVVNVSCFSFKQRMQEQDAIYALIHGSALLYQILFTFSYMSNFALFAIKLLWNYLFCPYEAKIF